MVVKAGRTTVMAWTWQWHSVEVDGVVVVSKKRAWEILAACGVQVKIIWLGFKDWESRVL
jgi:hypothetical protein